MSTKTRTRSAAVPKRYDARAYEFVFQALRCAQQGLGRTENSVSEPEDAHVSGPELLEGIRALGIAQFGLMTATVFRHWGVRSTEDFGRMVFELIETGKMKKTDRDQLSDFVNVYDFDDAFDRDYRFDTRNAFRN